MSGFYFRCVSCNDTLSPEYHKVGLCTECNVVVRHASNPEYTELDNIFVEKILWSNPMNGSLVGEDAEETYQGSGYHSE